MPGFVFTVLNQMHHRDWNSLQAFIVRYQDPTAIKLIWKSYLNYEPWAQSTDHFISVNLSLRKYAIKRSSEIFIMPSQSSQSLRSLMVNAYCCYSVIEKSGSVLVRACRYPNIQRCFYCICILILQCVFPFKSGWVCLIGPSFGYLLCNSNMKMVHCSKNSYLWIWERGSKNYRSWHSFSWHLID